MMLIPNSNGEADQPLREFNPHHDQRGRFTTGSTQVGITSARPKGDPGFKSQRQVFRDGRQFAAALNALPGVSHVKVSPGFGAWKGGKEASWVTSYRGNGEATKLLAATGKRFNQDAVLVLKGATAANRHPVAEWTFARPVTAARRDAIGLKLAAHGLTGWTWYKAGGKQALRAVSVPAWGGTTAAHLSAARKVTRDLARYSGTTHAVHYVAVKVMEKNGKRSYDRILKGTK
jgi:hypothetical protein